MVKVLLNLSPETTYDKMLEAEAKTQLQLAERWRAIRLDTETRAAEAEAAGTRARLAAFQAPLPEIKADIIAARQRVEAERLRTWEADQMRTEAVVPGEDDADYSPKGPSVRRRTRRFWRITAWFAVGVAAVLTLGSGSIAVVMGVLLACVLVVIGATLSSAERTDRLVRLLRALRSENPSIAESRGRDQRSSPQPLAKARRSVPASAMTPGSSEAGSSFRDREARATAKFCGSCGSSIGPDDIFCEVCGYRTA